MFRKRTSGKRCWGFLKWLMLVSMSSLCLAACARSSTGRILPLDEPFRPQYHFTPPAHWMNDPNGLVHLDGEFHLFYQHNPADTVWGPMHWGHAVSPDLVNWQSLPIALYPDNLGNIFSGSAVVDPNNTAGFGAGAMVAIFTHESDGVQRQSLAYSTDKGRTWTKYTGNPVLNTPNNLKNFRDPKVFRFNASGADGHWVMLVAAGNVILFYTSTDLKAWTPSGGFGLGYGSTSGVWETPDLFLLPVEGSPDSRWVLTVGVGDGAPAGGTGVQYFIGDFDGKVFKSQNPKETVLWADNGADFYAAQAWNNVPGQRQIWLGWMNNWSYAQKIPTSTWRGAFTLPRELGLAPTPAGLRLVQNPINELQRLRGQHWTWPDETITPAASNMLKDISGETLEITATFQLSTTGAADRFGIRVRVGDGERTTIGYATKAGTLFVDRTQSGQTAFSPGFSGIHTAEMPPSDGTIRLHIFVDRASVEVFGTDGLAVITDQIFPSSKSLGLELFADGGPVRLKSLEVYKLAPAQYHVLPDTSK
jgi:fructan beta-fructosidase